MSARRPMTRPALSVLPLDHADHAGPADARRPPRRSRRRAACRPRWRRCGGCRTGFRGFRAGRGRQAVISGRSSANRFLTGMGHLADRMRKSARSSPQMRAGRKSPRNVRGRSAPRRTRAGGISRARSPSRRRASSERRDQQRARSRSALRPPAPSSPRRRSGGLRMSSASASSPPTLRPGCPAGRQTASRSHVFRSLRLARDSTARPGSAADLQARLLLRLAPRRRLGASPPSMRPAIGSSTQGIGSRAQPGTEAELLDHHHPVAHRVVGQHGHRVAASTKAER